MNEIEIDNYLLTDPITAPHFRRVVSYDELSGYEKETGFFVVNLDESTGPGTHWVCLHLNNTRTEYFDSLGNEPKKLVPFLSNLKCDYIYNIKQLQSNDSDVCGDYCVLFCYLRSRGYTFEQILDSFSHDLIQNDNLVRLNP